MSDPVFTNSKRARLCHRVDSSCLGVDRPHPLAVTNIVCTWLKPKTFTDRIGIETGEFVGKMIRVSSVECPPDLSKAGSRVRDTLDVYNPTSSTFGMITYVHEPGVYGGVRV